MCINIVFSIISIPEDFGHVACSVLAQNFKTDEFAF